MQVVARAHSERGELLLSRRPDGSVELRVNGVFVMDTAETSTEHLLGRVALDALGDTSRDTPAASTPADGLTVLVGGLGLGFTLGEVLRSPRVAHAVVVEIEPALVSWHREGVVPRPGGGGSAGGLLADRRVRVEVGDVRDVVGALPAGSVDAIVLDVDNGPGFLVYDANAAVYREEFLSRCAAALRAPGVVAVWSSDPSSELLARLGTQFDRVDERAFPVTLGRRTTTYHVFVGHRLT